ncbi:MAG: hypothetical protein ACHQK9_00075 [Reyranellales bacterium]
MSRSPRASCFFSFIASGEEGVATVVLCLALFGLVFGIALSVGAALALSDVGDAAGTAASLSGFIHVGAAALSSAVSGLVHDGSAMPLSVILLFAGLAAFCTIPRLATTAVARQ